MLARNAFPRPVRTHVFHLLAGLATMGLLLVYGPVLMTCERNTLAVVAGLARQAHGLELALLGICSAAGLAVLVVILHSVGSFRSAGAQTGTFRLNPVKELLWALIPVVIVIGFALPSIQPLVAGGKGASLPEAVVESGYRCQPAR